MATPTSETRPTGAKREPKAVALMRRAAAQLGLRVRIIDPEFGHLFEITDGTRTVTLLGGRSPLNDAVAARLSEDKYYTGLILERAGVRVPRSVRCLKPGHFALEDYRAAEGKQPGLDFARAHGLPVIVKPNRLSHGRLVCVAHAPAEVSRAIERVWRLDYIALVQEPALGEDIRLDYLDGRYLAGYVRGPRTVGRNPDGAPQASEPGAQIEILNLARGARAQLLDDAPEAWHAYGLKIGRTLGLRHFGIDFKAASLASDPTQATVIEVNASPLLVQLHELGFPQAVAAQVQVLRSIWARSS